jgi:hypothetical protein
MKTLCALALVVLCSNASALRFLREEPITAFLGYQWPMSRILRHIVFEDETKELEYHLYKQETSSTPAPDLVRVFEVENALPDDWPRLEEIRDRLGLQNAAWYQQKMEEWLSNVEAAESSRDWPAQILAEIRRAVLERSAEIEYVAVYRRSLGGSKLVATLRRTISAHYYRGDSGTPVQSRRPLVLEQVFGFHLFVPRETVRPGISGGELNEIGGFWIADGENKETVSGEMLSLLLLLIDDARIPQGFRENGRRWVMFTDRFGHRYFGDRFGFAPLNDIASPLVRGKTRFFFGGVQHGTLRDKLNTRFPCGQQLLAQMNRLVQDLDLK